MKQLICGTIDDIVYGHIASCGKIGSTDEEGQESLSMSGNSYRPARISLERRGFVRRTNDRRFTKSGRPCKVFVAAVCPSLSKQIEVRTKR